MANSSLEPPSAAAGVADAVLTTEATVNVDGGLIPVATDETVLVLSTNHPLANQAALRPSVLRAFRILLPSQLPDTECPRLLNRLLGRTPTPPDVIRLPLTEAILDVARSGSAIAALSSWIADAHSLDGLVVKQLAGSPLRRRWGLTSLPEFSVEGAALAEALASVAPSLGSGPRTRAKQSSR